MPPACLSARAFCVPFSAPRLRAARRPPGTLQMSPHPRLHRRVIVRLQQPLRRPHDEKKIFRLE